MVWPVLPRGERFTQPVSRPGRDPRFVWWALLPSSWAGHGRSGRTRPGPAPACPHVVGAAVLLGGPGPSRCGLGRGRCGRPRSARPPTRPGPSLACGWRSARPRSMPWAARRSCLAWPGRPSPREAASRRECGREMDGRTDQSQRGKQRAPHRERCALERSALAQHSLSARQLRACAVRRWACGSVFCQARRLSPRRPGGFDQCLTSLLPPRRPVTAREARPPPPALAGHSGGERRPASHTAAAVLPRRPSTAGYIPAGRPARYVRVSPPPALRAASLRAAARRPPPSPLLHPGPPPLPPSAVLSVAVSLSGFPRPHFEARPPLSRLGPVKQDRLTSHGPRHAPWASRAPSARQGGAGPGADGWARRARPVCQSVCPRPRLSVFLTLDPSRLGLGARTSRARHAAWKFAAPCLSTPTPAVAASRSADNGRA